MVNGQGFVAAPPDNAGRVTFSERTPKGNVVAEFRRLGLEIDGRRHSPVKHIVDSPEVFESLARMRDGMLMEMLVQKPLVDVPASIPRTWQFTDHALQRLLDRNVGVFEVWSALQEPDYAVPEEDRPHVVHYMRGDLEIVVNTNHSSIVTVIDALEDRRTTPRVALAPALPVTNNRTTDLTPSEEAATMAKKTIEFDEYPSKSAAVRAWLQTKRNGETFDRGDMAEALPGPAGSMVNQRWQASAHLILRQLVDLGHITRLNPGEYRITNAEGIRAIAESTRETSSSGLTRAHAVRSGNEPRSYDRVYAIVKAAEAGAAFTSRMLGDQLSEHGYTAATITTALRRLADDKKLIRTQTTQDGMIVYVKPGKPKTPPPAPVPTPRTPASPAFVEAVSTTDPALNPVDPDDEYEVNVGFNFVQRLPKSDLFDLVDIIRQRRPDLEANPWGWAQVAIYSGGRASEAANKRAAALEAELKDPALRLQVRRISMDEVGLFVSRDPGTAKQ